MVFHYTLFFSINVHMHECKKIDKCFKQICLLISNWQGKLFYQISKILKHHSIQLIIQSVQLFDIRLNLKCKEYFLPENSVRKH